LENVKASLRSVEGTLQDLAARRERLIKESRDVIASCSRCIINLHNDKPEEAASELATARRILGELKKTASGQLLRYLIPPEAEFVEASVVFALIRGRPVPSISTLNSSPEAYVLGLLDSVGELKREVLDSLMKGKATVARKHFAEMEELYSALSPLASYDHIVNGARRKIDVARMIVEDTRGVLTEEAGREKLVSSMERLQKRLGSSG
jgi:translin